MKPREETSAPFYALNPSQRIGLLHDQRSIRCLQSLAPHFVAGEEYGISSRALALQRDSSKIATDGSTEALEISSWETFLRLTDDTWQSHGFAFHPEKLAHLRLGVGEVRSMEAFLDHFELPASPPDLAAAFPAQYAAHLAQLHALESSAATSANPFRFREFQLEDYARAALSTGAIIAHECGLGKTLAGLAIPLLWQARKTLIVTPAGLHQQWTEEAQQKFGLTLQPLRSQADFRADAALQSSVTRAGFWITSYEALGRNGTRGGLPSLAELAAYHFDAVVADEGVRLKSLKSLVSCGVRRMRPAHRLVLTGTPIKDKLEDIFPLAAWVCHADTGPNERWPFAIGHKGFTEFRQQFLEQERNLTREDLALAKTGQRRPQIRYSQRPTNLCRLWSVLSRVVLRRTKSNCGETIAPKTILAVPVKLGSAQKSVYQTFLQHPPILSAKRSTSGASVIGAGMAASAQLQLLRQAALCPDCPSLAAALLGSHVTTPRRSWTDLTPKSMTIYSLIAKLLSERQQVVVMSPFLHFSRRMEARLREAGVAVCRLDGDTGAAERGALVARFKAGEFSVLLAGIDSMSEGASLENCAHLIMASLSWSLDKNLQAIERVHRLNSTRPVTIYAMVTENTIDVRLESLFCEKRDSSQLALDGRLFTEKTAEINLAQLLGDAINGFDPSAPTLDEQGMEDQWERSLRERLRHAQATFDDPAAAGAAAVIGYPLLVNGSAEGAAAIPNNHEPITNNPGGTPALHFALPAEERFRLELPEDLFSPPASQYALL